MRFFEKYLPFLYTFQGFSPQVNEKVHIKRMWQPTPHPLFIYILNFNTFSFNQIVTCNLNYRLSIHKSLIRERIPLFIVLAHDPYFILPFMFYMTDLYYFSTYFSLYDSKSKSLTVLTNSDQF